MRRPLVLLVDDDPATRDMLELALSRLDAVTLTARDGLEAFGLAQCRAPDAIVTDLSMPRLDGAALIRRLRTTVWGREIPVVVFSGSPHRPGAPGALDEPEVFVVPKGDGPGAVVARLVWILGRLPAGDGA